MEEEELPNPFYKAVYYPDTKTRQIHQEKKLQVSVSDECWCKYLQQNTSKYNSKVHWKDYSLWPSGIYPWDTRMVQDTQINQCDTS